MGHRPRSLYTLLLEGDRGRLDGADPDRQGAGASGFLEQYDRLVGRQLYPYADNLQRMQSHLQSPSAIVDWLTPSRLAARGLSRRFRAGRSVPARRATGPRAPRARVPSPRPGPG